MTHAHELHLLTTYENRIRRSVEKNTAELNALQTQRRAAIAKAEEEARLLVQLAEAEGGDYDPTDDFPAESQPLGFVFSRPAIQRQIERSQRLGRALGLLNQPPDSNQQGPRPPANLRLIEKQAAATQN